MKKSRKPGGGRKPSKPDYDSKAILKKQMDAVVDLYVAGDHADTDEHPPLQAIADTLNLNPIKVRKLLITAGVYESDIADRVQQVFKFHIASGLSHKDAILSTMWELNLSKSSVTSYLPYEKGVYFSENADSKNLSVGAERIRRMRKCRSVLEELRESHSEEALWEAVIAFQGYRFRTYSGLVFAYSLKKGRGGAYTKELFIDRRENSKSLAWSSVLLTFRKTQGNPMKTAQRDGAKECGAAECAVPECPPLVDRPKALGDVRGVTYIYGIFYRFGLINVPESIKAKMNGKEPKQLGELSL